MSRFNQSRCTVLGSVIVLVVATAVTAALILPAPSASAGTPLKKCTDIKFGTRKIGVACVQTNGGQVNAFVDRYVPGRSVISLIECYDVLCHNSSPLEIGGAPDTRLWTSLFPNRYYYRAQAREWWNGYGWTGYHATDVLN